MKHKRAPKDKLPQRTISPRFLRSGFLAIGVGAIFGSGMTAQKAWSSATVSEPGWKTLSVTEQVEAKSLEYNRIREDIRLSFHHELQKRLPEKQEEAELEPDSPDSNQVAQNVTDQIKREPVKQDSALEQRLNTLESTQDDSSYAAEDIKNKDDSWMGDKGKAGQTNGASEQVSRQAKMAAALARVMGDETPSWINSSPSTKETASEPEGAGKTAAAPVSQGRFLVQVASFPSMDQAHKVKNQLAAKGYSVRLEKANIVGRGLSHRVQVTGFATHEAAADVREKISDGLGMRGIIVRE
jgi:cell division protein FtsN